MIGTDSYRIVIEIQSSTSESTACDYRNSPITITVIDNPPQMQSGPEILEPLRAKLLGEGVIRLFRDFDEDDENDPIKGTIANPGDDTMVSIIALPSYFTATDLLGFVGDHYMESITHIRILKSEKPNRFLVLIKFNDVVRAAEFQYHYDGKPFNSMEPETCHVVFVKSVVLDSVAPDLPNQDLLIPFLLQDPFTSTPSSPQISLSPKFQAEESMPIELPTCPVCLERLDYEITGLLTIPCQHTFHCLCLSKWRDDTCPICRYTNNEDNHKIRKSVRRLLQINSRMHQQQLQQQLQEEEGCQRSEKSEPSEKCANCLATTNLWVCLICGNVGCDRYAPQQHSLKHFVESGHCFAMELTTSRVWDYAGDNYVHRLIANEADGKIVELPEKGAGTSEGQGNQKDESESMEYSELLLSQLVSQREYYELLLNEKNSGRRRGSSIVEPSNKKVSELESKLSELNDKFGKLSSNVIPALKRKIDMKDTSLRIASNELSEANVLNEGLSNKIEHLSGKIDKLTEQNKQLAAQNEDLSDQVKDLMFFLESQEKFKNEPEDVREGTIVIQQKKGRKKR